MEHVLESCGAERELDSARRLLKDVIGELRFSAYQLDGRKNDRPVTVTERTATALFGAVACVLFTERVATEDGVRLLTLLHRRTVAAVSSAAARELHDEVAGPLAVALNCFELYEVHRTRRPRAAQERLDGARESVRESMAALRGVMARLRRPGDAVDQGGVRPLRAALLGDLTVGEGARVRVEVRGEELLSDQEARELFLIVREAQRNAVRHAKASYVTVSVDVRPEGAKARIEDDGRGFRPETAGAHGGGGLVSMRERAELLGGSLAVESGPGAGGTRVLVQVPLRGGRSAARG